MNFFLRVMFENVAQCLDTDKEKKRISRKAIFAHITELAGFLHNKFSKPGALIIKYATKL